MRRENNKLQQNNIHCNECSAMADCLLLFHRDTADQQKTRTGMFPAWAELRETRTGVIPAWAELRETRTGIYIPDVKLVMFVFTVGIYIQVLHLNILVLCFDILHTFTLGLFCIIFGFW